ncbi:MAG: hypothetical protein ACLFUU_05905 [Desulfobacteraceae bacterium]
MIDSKDDKPARDGLKVYAGVNWGLMTPTVILLGEHRPEDDRLTLVYEYYEEGVIIDGLIEVAKGLKEQHAIRKFYCNPSQPRFIEKFIQADLLAQAVADELEVGIGLVKKRLQAGQLTVARQCVNLIREFGQYSAPEKKAHKPYRDKPMDFANYALNALRFMVLGLTYDVNPNLTWI